MNRYTLYACVQNEEPGELNRLGTFNEDTVSEALIPRLLGDVELAFSEVRDNDIDGVLFGDYYSPEEYEYQYECFCEQSKIEALRFVAKWIEDHNSNEWIDEITFTTYCILQEK